MFSTEKVDEVRRSIRRHTELAGFFGGTNWHTTLGMALENAAKECSTPDISTAISKLQELLTNEPPLRSRATASAQLPAGLNGEHVVDILLRALPADVKVPNLLEPINAIYDKGSHTAILTMVMKYNPSSASMAADNVLEAAIRCAIEDASD